MRGASLDEVVDVVMLFSVDVDDVVSLLGASTEFCLDHNEDDCDAGDGGVVPFVIDVVVVNGGGAFEKLSEASRLPTPLPPPGDGC